MLKISKYYTLFFLLFAAFIVTVQDRTSVLYSPTRELDPDITGVDQSQIYTVGFTNSTFTAINVHNVEALMILYQNSDLAKK